jgi:23S rRNA pseudouridine1911/1915/1917 synthase
MKYYYSIIFLLLILLISVFVILLKKRKIYNGELKILYEDDYIIVIDKPAGIAVHDAPNWTGPTVVDTLKYQGHHLYKVGIPFQYGVVHRLDVGTSGLLVLAKNEYAYKSLKKQFKNRTITKIYHALIQGNTEYSNGSIYLRNGLVNEEENIYGVVSNGKPSITHYKTLKIFQGLSIINTASLLEINLETGRTHQIRVHLSHLGHPLIGDTKYGSNLIYDYLIGMTHQWLHAKKLEFDHPSTGKRLYFNIDYPEDLKYSLYLLSNHII